MTKVDILQGALDMLILKTLSHDPMRGFAIALRIRRRRRGDSDAKALQTA